MKLLIISLALLAAEAKDFKDSCQKLDNLPEDWSYASWLDQEGIKVKDQPTVMTKVQKKFPLDTEVFVLPRTQFTDQVLRVLRVVPLENVSEKYAEERWTPEKNMVEFKVEGCLTVNKNIYIRLIAKEWSDFCTLALPLDPLAQNPFDFGLTVENGRVVGDISKFIHYLDQRIPNTISLDYDQFDVPRVLNNPTNDLIVHRLPIQIARIWSMVNAERYFDQMGMGRYYGCAYNAQSVYIFTNPEDVLGRDGTHLVIGQRPGDVRVEFYEKLAKAIHQLHQMGIVHNDIRPGSFYYSNNEVGLLNFWATQEIDQPDLLFGTPAYMSWNRFVGGFTDPRDDVYSWAVCVIIFEAGQGEDIFDNLLDFNFQLLHPLTPLNVYHNRSPILFLRLVHQIQTFGDLGDTTQTLNISQMSLMRILYEILMLANPNITFEALIPEFPRLKIEVLNASEALNQQARNNILNILRRNHLTNRNNII